MKYKDVKITHRIKEGKHIYKIAGDGKEYKRLQDVRTEINRRAANES